MSQDSYFSEPMCPARGSIRGIGEALRVVMVLTAMLAATGCSTNGRQDTDGALVGAWSFEEEGARCASLLRNPKVRTMIMGNHGVLVIGETVAETFNRLYYFERAAETYIRALQTGQPLRVLPDEIAEKTALEWEQYPDLAGRFLSEIRAMLDDEGADYRA